MFCFSADQFAEHLLESSGADVKRSRLEGRNGSLMWKWTLEYLDRLWHHVKMKGSRQRRHRRRFPQYLHSAPPPDSHVLEMRGQGVHAKALRISAFWSEIGRTPGRDEWIWRLHGAMNGMRTASRDFTEFQAGILPEHMGFKRGKLERCLFVHESNETRVVSHVDDPLICAKPATLEKFWMQRIWSLT